MDEPEAAELFRAALQSSEALSRVTLFGATDSRSACPVRTPRKRPPPTPRRAIEHLERDDTVMIHCNSYVDGFWTDITRTYTFGHPMNNNRKCARLYWPRARLRLHASSPALAPRTWTQHREDAITNFGLAEYLRHGTGHGVGFLANECL